MGRQIKVIDATTRKSIEIDDGQIKSGPIRNHWLTESLLTRVRAVHRRIKKVYNITLERFELTFMRDSNPEDEVATWEAITAGLERVIAISPNADQKFVLRTLLAYSMDALTSEEERDAAVKWIIETVEQP